MKNFVSKNHRLLFYSSWLLLSLVQSAFTELLDDEAYYWVYSKFPAWGYFDHPPMIAVMIRAGYSVFHNELGVRLVGAFMNLFSLAIIEKLVPGKKPKLFYAIALSLAILQVGGFLAAPDIPLIFFTALFFLAYKKFIARASFLNILFLALVMALLLYSKYHGVLVIFFVLVSNLKLFTRYHIYTVGVLALLFFIPHIYWQYQHDWISINYHLFESNVDTYKFSYTVEYLLGQLLMAGPVAGFILLPAAFLYKPDKTDRVEKGLKFTLYGIYIFFLVSSFKGSVEANWTSPAIVPLIILSHGFLYRHLKWQKFLYKTLPVTLFIVFVIRFAMIIDFIPVKGIKRRFHSWNHWPALMKEKTKGLPVVWNSSYQRASKYWFYTGQVSYSLNSYRDRKNNYNYWPLEDSLLLKPVYNMDVHNVALFPDTMHTPMRTIGYRYDPSFVSFSKINIDVGENNIEMNNIDTLDLHCNVSMSHIYRQLLTEIDPNNFVMKVGVFGSKQWIKDIPLAISPARLSGLHRFVISIPMQLENGNYDLRFSLQWKDYPGSYNSKKIGLQVQ